MENITVRDSERHDIVLELMNKQVFYKLFKVHFLKIYWFFYSAFSLLKCFSAQDFLELL